jgi:soluble lytic murein transglycosylase-like protein
MPGKHRQTGNRLMGILFTPKAIRGGMWTCLLAALAGVGSGLLSTADCASITAFRDPSGRVIFVNEEAPVPATARAAQKVAKASSAKAAPALGSSRLPAAAAKLPAQQPGKYPKEAVVSMGLRSPGAVLTAAFRGAWDEMIAGTASRHQVDPKLVRAIVRVESNFNPYAISPRGARGLMQLIPATARRFGVSDVFDPGANLDGGVRYLKYLMNLYGGDVKLSLAAYNAGENAVAGYNGIPPYRETQDYLRKISELYPLTPTTELHSNTGIDKYVDTNGIVHFSNVDLP